MNSIIHKGKSTRYLIIIIIFMSAFLICIILNSISCDEWKDVNITIDDLSFILRGQDLSNSFNLEGKNFSSILLANFEEIRIPNITKIWLYSNGKEHIIPKLKRNILVIKSKDNSPFGKCIMRDVVINKFDIKKDARIAIKVNRNDSAVTFAISDKKVVFEMIGTSMLEFEISNENVIIDNEFKEGIIHGRMKIELDKESKTQIIAKPSDTQLIIWIPLPSNGEYIDGKIKAQKITSIENISLRLIQDGMISKTFDDMEHEKLYKGDLIEMIAKNFIEIDDIRISIKGIELKCSGKFKKLYNVRRNRDYIFSLLKWLYHNEFILIWAIITNFLISIIKVIWDLDSKNKKKD